jgi:hypothetical protein
VLVAFAGVRSIYLSIYLITHLPRTAGSHDSIITFTDRFSKLVVLIPCSSTIDAPGYADLFFQHLYRKFGLPRSLVSDRDPRFTSNFWKALMKRVGTRLDMSTAFHPQTDGQSERTNRTVEDMLRATIAPDQRDWDLLLPLIEFAYNDLVQASTGYTPFFLAMGYHPRTPLSLLAPDPEAATTTRSPSVDPRVTLVQQVMAVVRHNLLAAQQRQKVQADQHRRQRKFSVGDLVLLSTAPHSPPSNQPQAVTSLDWGLQGRSCHQPSGIQAGAAS